VLRRERGRLCMAEHTHYGNSFGSTTHRRPSRDLGHARRVVHTIWAPQRANASDANKSGTFSCEAGPPANASSGKPRGSPAAHSQHFPARRRDFVHCMEPGRDGAAGR
jgi:hypothetical protein